MLISYLEKGTLGPHSDPYIKVNVGTNIENLSKQREQ